MTTPSDNLRKALKSRAIKTLSTKVITSPSERKSKRMRDKLNRGQPDARELSEDCRGCEKDPCGKSLNVCDEKQVVGRCGNCGIKVRYRFIFGEFNYKCPICRA